MLIYVIIINIINIDIRRILRRNCTTKLCVSVLSDHQAIHSVKANEAKKIQEAISFQIYTYFGKYMRNRLRYSLNKNRHLLVDGSQTYNNTIIPLEKREE